MHLYVSLSTLLTFMYIFFHFLPFASFNFLCFCFFLIPYTLLLFPFFLIPFTILLFPLFRISSQDIISFEALPRFDFLRKLRATAGQGYSSLLFCLFNSSLDLGPFLFPTFIPVFLIPLSPWMLHSFFIPPSTLHLPLYVSSSSWLHLRLLNPFWAKAPEGDKAQ